MKIITVTHYDALSQQSAEDVSTLIHEGLKANNHFVLGLATGATPMGMYKHLVPMLARFSADLSGLHTFNLDEYYGLTRDNKNSYYAEMMAQFWKPLHDLNPTFKIEHAHIPNTEATDAQAECKHYEGQIKKAGGIDLQILGIGTNGHIAFNEPGSAGDSRTRLVDIATETIKVNAEKFFNGDISKVPTTAMSMGIGTILEAKKIFLLVSGPSKQEILHQTLANTAPTTHNPASFLHTHPDVTIYTDISS
ncbi:glucosamine-6-phosphate deaminase [Candidatus Woesebacteria bacterium]|nr:glucosamine-6-phosphate deaminase [Candidatus Woesebacteria bacterium]